MSKKRLRIAVACFPTLGGSGVVASDVGAGLAARGHEVRFFATEPPARLDLGLPRVSFQRVAPSAPPTGDVGTQAFALTGALVAAAQAGFDVIHAHYAIPHAASAVFARTILRSQGARLPRLVTTLHGTDVTALGVDPEWRQVVRHAVLESDAITTPSAWLRDRAVEHLGVESRAIEVIPNFVDATVFRPATATARDLFPGFSWDGPGQKPQILLHGSSFRAVKRVSTIVEALALLKQNQERRGTAGKPPREIGLVLAGDGPEREDVLALVHRLGLQKSVRHVGATPHFETLLACSDVFLLASKTESFGLAALEALAAGVPVVTNAEGGIRDVVRHGETGLLVERDDVAAFAEAVRTLLDDEPRRRAMGRAARADAIARFSPEPALDHYERVLTGNA